MFFFLTVIILSSWGFFSTIIGFLETSMATLLIMFKYYTYNPSILNKPFHGNMRHVFDGAKLFISNTRCRLRPKD